MIVARHVAQHSIAWRDQGASSAGLVVRIRVHGDDDSSSRNSDTDSFGANDHVVIGELCLLDLMEDLPGVSHRRLTPVDPGL
jgi:hypothetical protein